MKFFVCIDNQDYPASLEVRKLYQVLDDDRATQSQMLHIIDESGKDYLYPASYFAEIELPENLQQKFGCCKINLSVCEADFASQRA